MMIHVAAAVPLPTGTVLISAPGISAPSADYFTITVTGMGCHGSMPHEGVDALNAACHILIALQEINARELSIADQAVLTVGTLHAGSASNAIAGTAVMGGTIRCFDERIRNKIKSRMCQISEAIASAYRAKAEISFDTGAPTLKNDAAMCAFAEKTLTELLGNSAISVSRIESGKPSAGGSEDFAYVSQQIPTVMLSLAAGNPKDGYTHPLHHPKTAFDESAMTNGVAALSYCAYRFLAE
jgi:hippurate hydrolase